MLVMVLKMVIVAMAVLGVVLGMMMPFAKEEEWDEGGSLGGTWSRSRRGRMAVTRRRVEGNRTRSGIGQ